MRTSGGFCFGKEAVRSESVEACAGIQIILVEGSGSIKIKDHRKDVFIGRIVVGAADDNIGLAIADFPLDIDIVNAIQPNRVASVG